jgi:hypothetical protein
LSCASPENDCNIAQKSFRIAWAEMLQSVPETGGDRPPSRQAGGILLLQADAFAIFVFFHHLFAPANLSRSSLPASGMANEGGEHCTGRGRTWAIDFL